MAPDATADPGGTIPADQQELLASTASWTPLVTLDIATANQKRFEESLEVLRESRYPVGQEPPLGIADGWHDVGPQQAEDYLRRNAGNREPSLGTVKYYARIMADGDWKETGQPLLFCNNRAIDLQHRCLAVYFSGATIRTYVVTSVPDIPNVFAYIDGVRPRSAADALSTAGHNGQSPAIVSAISLAQGYDANAFTPTKRKRVERVTPSWFLDYVERNPLVKRAAHLMAADFKSATSLIGDRGVAVFVGYKLLQNDESEQELELFMQDLGDEQPAEPGTAMAALRKVLKADHTARDPMAKHQKLAHVIKGYNKWKANEPVQRLSVGVNEAFPRFDEPEQYAEAAE